MRSTYPAVIGSAVVIADRLSKLYIDRHFGPYDEVGVIPHWLRIIHTENPGAAFGMLAEGNPALRGLVLIGISGLVLLFVVSALWGRRSAFQTLGTRIGLSLVLGGALGNLYDRIVRGTVTDFIEVYHGAWSFPSFNVADSAITVGAAFMVIDMMRTRR